MKFKKIKILGFKSFVDQTDFDIEHGLTGIVGPNGCGKSTLAKVLSGVLPIDKGKVSILGHTPTSPVMARKLETTGHEVLKAVHPHPTMSEAVMEAVADAYDEVIHI